MQPEIEEYVSQHLLTDPKPSSLIDCGRRKSVVSIDSEQNEMKTNLLSERRLQNQLPKSRRVLLLQGPVGPFFFHLQIAFENASFETKRVLFHSADALFAPRRNTVRVSGDIHSWKNWIQSELESNRPDAVVLFGSNRPAHKIARDVAHSMDVEIIALEEGYLRPGFITCELGGNNQHSPLLDWKPTRQDDGTEKPLKFGNSFAMMGVWGTIYFTWREFRSRQQERSLYHRQTKGFVREGALWVVHIFGRLLARLKEKRLISQILSSDAGGYIFVPL